MTLEIHSVWDNGGATFDRYSIYLTLMNRHNGLHDCLAMSENPEDPQGFSQFCMGEPGDHNGRKIEFTDLPENIQQHARARLE